MDWKILDSHKVHERLKLKEYNKPTSSSWIAYEQNDHERIKTLYLLPAYKENITLILNEFKAMGEEQKMELRPFLSEWLSQADVSDLGMDNQKLRDFIYEMF